jgi:ferredoxin
MEDELKFLRQRAQVVSQRLEVIRQKIEGQKIVDPQRVVAIVDNEECTCCGLCYEVCPVGAISMNVVAKIDSSKCTACLACVKQCPQGAIAVKYPDR